MSIVHKQQREGSRNTSAGESAGGATTVALLAGALTAATASVVSGRAGELADGADDVSARAMPRQNEAPAPEPTQAGIGSDASGHGDQPRVAQDKAPFRDDDHPARASGTEAAHAVEAPAPPLSSAGEGSDHALSHAQHIVQPAPAQLAAADAPANGVPALGEDAGVGASTPEPGPLEPAVAAAGAALVERLATEASPAPGFIEPIANAVGQFAQSIDQVFDGVSTGVETTISQLQDRLPGSDAISDKLDQVLSLAEAGLDLPELASSAIDIPVTLLGAETVSNAPDGLLARLFDGAGDDDTPGHSESYAAASGVPAAEIATAGGTDGQPDALDYVAEPFDALPQLAMDVAPSITLPKLGFAGLSYADSDADLPHSGGGHLLQGLL